MKKIALQIALLAALLLTVCIGYRWAVGNRYTVFIPVWVATGESLSANGSADQIVKLSSGGTDRTDGCARVQIRPRHRGETTMRFVSEAGLPVAVRSYRVGPLMTVYDPSTGGFTGDSVVMLSFTIFCLAVAFLTLRWFLNVDWREFYSYGTIHAAGFSIFALLTGTLMAYVTFRHIADPAAFPMLSAYSEISRASWGFMAITAPMVLVFAVAMAVSNIALLRHEGACLKNLLGILTGVILTAGLGIGWILYRQDAQASGILEAMRGVYATVFAYFECMMMGAILCGLMAARHKPAYDRDYIVILGCRFRRDGTLTPLLRGRVDAAIAFWKAQKDATGKEAVFIPSGGQGSDEVMPEAEAMRRYLISQGIPEKDIIDEACSRNTYQNMLFSKELIGTGDAKIAYATTNYHVFRSGVWASLAGLSAEGIGSRTIWWYWPNAFMRECLGLLNNRWRQELLGLLALIGLNYAVSTMLV
ncbi:MAG: YdcF family protein [Clostridia bacterium]|nr:YdcF family protein [Clostridia bacterium]